MLSFSSTRDREKEAARARGEIPDSEEEDEPDFNIADPFKKLDYNELVKKVINPLVPGKSRCGFKNAIFNLVFFFRSSYDNVPRWRPQDRIDDKLTSMARCCQAASHFLSKWWAILMSPYGITISQWVNKYNCFQEWSILRNCLHQCFIFMCLILVIQLYSTWSMHPILVFEKKKPTHILWSF